ncbi:MAG: ABC transporter permease subunit [Chloroflexota bacterium]
MFNLFKHELFSRWTSILGWGLGLAAFASMYIAVYPEMAAEMEGLAAMTIYRAMGIDLASFAGFIASVVVQIMPIILGVYVIMASTQTLAGEDDNGTLELVVAMPLQRWQIVAMKTAALSIVLLLIILIMGAGAAFTLTIVSQTIEVDVTAGQLFVSLMGAYPLMLAYFCMGLFLGTIVPSRRIAIAIMAVIYIMSYVLNSVALMIEAFDYLQVVSLFSYVNTTADVFTDGLAIGDIAVLLTVALVFFGLAIVAFERRNITVGQWIWQQGQASA